MPNVAAIETTATCVISGPQPIGRVLIEATARGVRQVRFVDELPSVRPPAVRTIEYRAAERHAMGAGEQLAGYFAGQLKQFDLALDPEGTPFQRRVWDALLAIPFGQTTTYARLASAVGNPKASRAVGLANGANPIAVLIPCHRVIGSDGSLTGYAGGLDRKGWLLGLEGAGAGLFQAGTTTP